MGRNLLVVAVALAAGTSGSSASAAPIPPFGDSENPPEQRVSVGSGTVLTLRAPDPEGGQPPWTLRVSRSITGLECSAVGQLDGEAFGLLGLDGAFRALPEANADACGRPGTLVGARVFAARRPRNVRTVVSGVAGPGLRRVTLEAGGRARTVPHSSEGAFVHVLRGYPEDVRPLGHAGDERRYPPAVGLRLRRRLRRSRSLWRPCVEADGVRVRRPAVGQAASRADRLRELHDRARG